MGTRGAIGYIEDEGVARCVYTHWDSYMSHHVPVIRRLVGETFDGDHRAALRYLIDDYPQGWSSLAGSGKPFNMRERPIGDYEATEDCDHHYAEDEGDSVLRVNLKTGEFDAPPGDMGIEWLYVLDADGIGVFKVGGVGFFGMPSGPGLFQVTHLRWDEPCPSHDDLERMQSAAYDQAAEAQAG